MSLDARQRHPKDTNCNQSYLNFIKKNQLFIHEEMHNLTSPKSTRNQETLTLSPHLRENPIGQKSQNPKLQDNSKVFHHSLSKFQFENHQINQVSKIYSMAERKQKALPLQHGESEQQTIALLHMRTKHAKHEAAKQLIMGFHKNKSIQAKRSDIRESIDRYKPNLEIRAQTSFKFPFIQKKNIASFAAETMKDETSLENFREEIRDRMNSLLNKSLEKQNEKHLDDEKKKEQQKEKEKTSISNRFRMREELYGLLPVFRTPVINGHKTKNPSFQRKSSKKIGSEPAPVGKDMIQHYLQQNVTSKMFLAQKNKQILRETPTLVFIQTPTIATSQQLFVESYILQNKQQLELLQKIQKSEDNVKQLQLQTIDKQVIQPKQVTDIKSKTKKQPISLTDMKYQGELTVYELKIRSYRQFLFMVNLAHRIYDPILLKDANSLKPQHRYKFYLGKGNNYLLVKSLLQRRFWWTVEEDPKKANFVWTQLKVNYFYQYERKSCIQSKHYKLDQDFPLNQNLKKKKSKVPPVSTKAGVYKAPLPPNDRKIFTNADKHHYDEFLQKIDNPQKMLKFSNRLKLFDQNLLKPRSCQSITHEKVHNHLQYNYFIGNKKALFYNLKQYYDLQKKNVFDIIPLTYHIKNGTSDSQYDSFTRQFKRLAKEKASGKNLSKNIWIVKPGELSNRGQGITVIDQIYELNNIIKKKEKHFNGSEKTYIVQKYIQKPLLYKNRKFDIRHYMMISKLHGVMRAYWFGQGYIRTSSYQFDIGEIGQSIIHLTNDAIQKYSDGYGKYQQGNKVSYSEFQRYMDSTYGQGKFSFSEMIYPKMKSIALDAVKATFLQLDPNNAQHNFEIFGLDFMIDANYNVWLIEVNTNPCLELSSKLLARLIPTMVEHSFRLSLDVIFPPPSHYPNSQKYLAPDNPLERLQFQLIFDENRDGKVVQQLFADAKQVDMGEVDEQDETYENDGKQIELDNEIE